MLKDEERFTVVAVEPGSCGIVTQHSPILVGSSVAASACFFWQHGIVSMPDMSMPDISSMSDISMSGMSIPAMFFMPDIFIPGMASIFGIISMPDIMQTC